MSFTWNQCIYYPKDKLNLIAMEMTKQFTLYTDYEYSVTIEYRYDDSYFKVVIDPNHDLNGQTIKDKVLFIPGGKGSTVGSYVIFQMMKNNTAPKAIICLNAEPIIATGAIMSDIPMVDSPSDTKDLINGALVEVDGDNGIITSHYKSRPISS